MIMILGSGLTGLSLSFFLNKKNIKSKIIEKESYIGGLCSVLSTGNFKFERVQHLIHIRDPEIKDFIEKDLNVPLNTFDRKAKIWFKNRLIPYPFQANLYYLPLKEKLSCLITFIWSRMFFLNKRYVLDSSYKEWSIHTFGLGISKYFMFPYNEKIWNTRPEDLTIEWMGRLVPVPSFKEIISGIFKKNIKQFGYNQTFYYPKNGNISIIPSALNLGNIEINDEVTSIDFKKKLVSTKKGNTYNYDSLVNTMPLTQFISLIQNCPVNIRRAADLLRFTGIFVLNIGFRTNSFAKEFHWCYFPEKKYKFYRIGIASNVSKNLTPEGYSSCYIEYNSSVFDKENKTEIIEETIQQLLKIGIINSQKDIKVKKLVYIPYAYVIYDKNYHQSLSIIQTYLNSMGVNSVGRFGSWEYSYIERNIKEARDLALNMQK